MKCCQSWEDAQKAGTDSEAYGELLTRLNDGTWEMGFGLPKIRFCPWCGKVVEEKKEDEMLPS